MQVLFVRLDGDLCEWELISSKGCCRFPWRSVGGLVEVDVRNGCPECINEASAFTLKRGHKVIRVP
jgi:hypothetical protein